MTRRGLRTGGILAAGVGTGVLAWALYPTIARSLSGVVAVSLVFQPSAPAAAEAWQAIVTARGAAGAQLAAQGAVVQADGLVGAHLWSSAAIASAVYAQYSSVYDATTGTPAQKAAAAEAAVAAQSASPQSRLAIATAGSDGTAQLTLYSEPLQPGTYSVVALVARRPAGLIAGDPVGTTLAALQRSPAPLLAVRLVLA